ncbi:hypothetical protein GCM10009557_01340 [Virgisporangium ochraceum]|uniref:Uncharacterized protein n=1 Tax=Virgisporangium ochraceum TaxID=65505 RepID=A0A8J4A6D1_9ACTN|nr:hypothetical protein [Virgisporangium ochraceum]GIJ74165.1 hypothetical protein Voc01_090820 [Virgisporangium ochraceum]
MTGEEADRADEVWTYAGRREHKGKRLFAWHDPRGAKRFFSKLPGLTIGGRYTISVSRDDDDKNVTVYGEARYTGERIDDEQMRREMEALDVAAAARLAAQARDRSDARRKALDDAVGPLAAIARKLAFGHERDAFLAHVIRRITRDW